MQQPFFDEQAHVFGSDAEFERDVLDDDCPLHDQFFQLVLMHVGFVGGVAAFKQCVLLHLVLRFGFGDPLKAIPELLVIPGFI